MVTGTLRSQVPFICWPSLFTSMRHPWELRIQVPVIVFVKHWSFGASVVLMYILYPLSSHTHGLLCMNTRTVCVGQGRRGQGREERWEKWKERTVVRTDLPSLRSKGSDTFKESTNVSRIEKWLLFRSKFFIIPELLWLPSLAPVVDVTAHLIALLMLQWLHLLSQHKWGSDHRGRTRTMHFRYFHCSLVSG